MDLIMLTFLGVQIKFDQSIDLTLLLPLLQKISHLQTGLKSFVVIVNSVFFGFGRWHLNEVQMNAFTNSKLKMQSLISAQKGVEVTFNKEEMNEIQKRSLDYIIEYENNTEQLNTRQFSSMLFNSKLELLVDRFNLQIENQKRIRVNLLLYKTIYKVESRKQTNSRT
ncbi:Hypothetical_protein [Hexamita inflata]|uniref:Hypothetical_protein n=1 Tax=Hexamita inflata TaxID=28002 RepID=A0AA86NQS5_9EUKA|nr:Hypothetical protein HINF_LOCUS11333 [Hexamita inflata]